MIQNNIKLIFLKILINSLAEFTTFLPTFRYFGLKTSNVHTSTLPSTTMAPIHMKNSKLIASEFPGIQNSWIILNIFFNYLGLAKLEKQLECPQLMKTELQLLFTQNVT
jgi:hypothetical protein